jgi:hypothetical protein
MTAIRAASSAAGVPVKSLQRQGTIPFAVVVALDASMRRLLGQSVTGSSTNTGNCRVVFSWQLV